MQFLAIITLHTFAAINYRSMFTGVSRHMVWTAECPVGIEETCIMWEFVSL